MKIAQWIFLCGALMAGVLGAVEPELIEELPPMMPKNTKIVLQQPANLPMGQMNQGKGGLWSGRIINGKLVEDLAKYPYSAGILVVKDDGNAFFLCSGVIIADNLVMTAGHCSYPKQGNLVVCVGSADLSESEGRRCYTVVDKRVNRRFKRYVDEEDRILSEDIAILKTAKPVVGEGTQAIKISFADPPTGLRAFVLGFGHIDPMATIIDLQLRVLDTGIFPSEMCMDNDMVLERSFICVWGNYDGSEGSPCQGDSGAPIIDTRDSLDPADHYLIGINSFGFELPGTTGTCNPRAPAAAVKLSHRRTVMWVRWMTFTLGGSLEGRELPDDWWRS